MFGETTNIKISEHFFNAWYGAFGQWLAFCLTSLLFVWKVCFLTVASSSFCVLSDNFALWPLLSVCFAFGQIILLFVQQFCYLSVAFDPFLFMSDGFSLCPKRFFLSFAFALLCFLCVVFFGLICCYSNDSELYID